MNEETRQIHQAAFDYMQERLERDEIFFTEVRALKVVDNPSIRTRVEVEVRQSLKYWQARFVENPHADFYAIMESASIAYQHIVKNVKLREA